MFNLIATVLAWFYEITHNYAAAIALLTLTVMVLLTPLTLKATKSMLELQRHQPEIRRMQQEFKGDRQRLNEEMMKFYQEHKINPLGGCLPMVLQTPVFIILYRVVYKLTLKCPSPGKDFPGRCVTSTGKQIAKDGFGPSYISKTSQLYQDLAGKTQMRSIGLDLSRSAVRAMSDSFAKGLPYLVFILIVVATSYYQQRQITVRNQQTGQPVNPQQQMLMRIFPAFFAIFSLFMPAAIVVYFLVSNLYRIGQQGYITHAFYREDHPKGGGPGTAAKGDDSSKGVPPVKPKSGPGSNGSAKQPSAGDKARPAPRTSGRVTPPKAANRPQPSKATPGARPAKPAPGKQKPSPSKDEKKG